MSEAFRAMDERHWRGWDWGSTTILFISWDWGPASGPEALAGRRLVAPLLEAGARVHVLTAAGPDDTLRCSNYDVTVVPHPPVSDNRAVRTWQMLRHGIPEPAGPWISSAVQAGVRVLASLPGDTILYGRAMPGSSNIVGWHLARLTGLTSVAHFSDPWPPVQMRSHRWDVLTAYKWPLFQFWRRRIIEDADALTFTNPDQALAVLGRQRQRYLGKSFVVTHLPSDEERVYREPQSNQFHIVHTGNFYSLRHNAAALMQGLQLFLERTPAARGRVRFTQAGWQHGDLPEWTTRCGLGDVVSIVGRLTQADLTTLIDSASLLIAVDYAIPNSPVVVSKLPDYIAARRPILAITTRDSAMGRLFNEDGAGLTADYNSPAEVAERIGQVFDAWQQRRFDLFLPQATATASFTRPRALAELAGAFHVARRRRAALANTAARPLPLVNERASP